jgi:hypothetical protein
VAIKEPRFFLKDTHQRTCTTQLATLLWIPFCMALCKQERKRGYHPRTETGPSGHSLANTDWTWLDMGKGGSNGFLARHMSSAGS